MGKIILKKLDMSRDIDKKILLTYFFKKLDTIVSKDQLLTMCSICYNSKQKSLFAHTKRFQKELEPYKNQKILNVDANETLQKALSKKLSIHEELVRCELKVDSGTDYFYITVIGIDFFTVESELRK